MYIFITFLKMNVTVTNVFVNSFIQDVHFVCDGAFALSDLRTHFFCSQQTVARVENQTRQELQ